jgi:Icc-related predicted phosphoesterase
MKICCISDIHSNLKFDVPECDLLLIAGDICPATRVSPDASIERALDLEYNINLQAAWLEDKFKKWLYDQPIEYAIFTPGNHDWIWEFGKERVPTSWFPGNTIDREMVANARIESAEDYLVFYKGLKIYGTPVQLPFCDWAFNRPEKQIQGYWGAIPEGLDILLLHSPPYGILDRTNHPSYPSEHIGSKSLLKRIKEVKPKLVVFGHNHGSHGEYEEDGIKYVNASLVDERYKMTRKPIMVEMEL